MRYMECLGIRLFSEFGWYHVGINVPKDNDDCL